jgi:hypothetical protein
VAVTVMIAPATTAGTGVTLTTAWEHHEKVLMSVAIARVSARR